jgi:hypothetical protein
MVVEERTDTIDSAAPDRLARGSQRKLRIAMLVPDGVGIRNFVLGPFLTMAESEAEVHVFHLVEDAVLPQYAAGHSASRWHRLPAHKETPVTYILRQILANAHRYWMNNGPAWMDLRRPIRGSWKTRAAYGTGRVAGRLASTPSRMTLLDRVHGAAMSSNPATAHFRKLFGQIRPDVVFCTHQRPTEVIAPVLAAREMGIPTATFIFSWDNLTSKGRIVFPFDHYLLWSQLMREELARFYPEISPERTHIVGTPQFDVYADPRLLWSREEFCRRIGADPSRKIIGYSGGDEDSSKLDQFHVRALLEAIRSGAIAGNPQVVMRPAPIDKGVRFESVRRDFPELIYKQPDWLFGRNELCSYLMPRASDVQMLANFTRHSDVNVNFASTMTLDFAIHDRPVVNVLFDGPGESPYGIPAWDFVRKFEHYEAVVRLGAAKLAHSREEMAAYVDAYLKDPSLDREKRKKLVDLQVGIPVGHSSRKIIDTLGEIAGR